MDDATDSLSNDLPLARGASGPAVRDLQIRLRRCGCLGATQATGLYDDATAEAVMQFQERVRLDPSGECDHATWSSLVEAGYELGDRLLYHRVPMLRGDDVAALQRRLSELGFLGDRVDGIFGPNTEDALRSFQRNTGLVTDGVAGPDVVGQLRRLGPGIGSVTKALLTERLHLLEVPHALSGARVAIGESGSLPALSRNVTSRLDAQGAQTLAIHHPDGSAQSAEANRFDAHCFIGWTLGADNGARLSFYRTEGYESAGGRTLADVLARQLEAIGFPGKITTHGMRLPVLRETRMPALWCEFGVPGWVVEHAADLAAAITTAVGDWMAAPLGDENPPSLPS